MIRRLFVRTAALLSAVLSIHTAAQPVPAIEAPRLVITGPADAAVTLRAVRVNTQISGRNALTEITLTFFNPNPRTLEGELQFPLQDGQATVGMAMDVNGKLREAVPVDKARGETVFEAVTRTQIDPALLSHTQANNHKWRVDPIEARERQRRSFDRRDFAANGVLNIACAPPAGDSITTQWLDGRTFFLADQLVAAIAAPRAMPRIVALVRDSSGSGADRDRSTRSRPPRATMRLACARSPRPAAAASSTC